MQSASTLELVQVDSKLTKHFKIIESVEVPGGLHVLLRFSLPKMGYKKRKHILDDVLERSRSVGRVLLDEAYH